MSCRSVFGGGVLLLVTAGCADDSVDAGRTTTSAEAEQTGAKASSSGVAGEGFTPDFRAFLATFEPSIDFARGDLAGASAFGGRATKGERLRRQPVVFVHGNSDRGIGGKLGGWQASLQTFGDHGYAPRELYAFTWGPASATSAAMQYHSRAHLVRVRRFLEAVLAYTGAAKVDVVGHSMGVTLARKAIAGGPASDLLDGGAYDLGEPLTDRVDAFVGIAGGNLGLTSCWFTGPSTPTCGATNGFFPGTKTFGGAVFGRSAFIDELIEHPHAEGARVYSMWSPGDEVLGAGGLVWGEVTARLPAQDDELVLPRSFGHMDSKDKTAEEQWRLVSNQP